MEKDSRDIAPEGINFIYRCLQEIEALEKEKMKNPLASTEREMLHQRLLGLELALELYEKSYNLKQNVLPIHRNIVFDNKPSSI